MKSWDIIGYGIVAVDDFFVVEAYPPPDSKIPVLETFRYGGGLCGTALVAASRLGTRCAYAGVLGDDDLSAYSIAELEREGVDCSPVLKLPQARPYLTNIVVDRSSGTRTIFYSGEGVTPRPVSVEDESLLAASRLLLVDHLGVEETLARVRLAHRLGIPVVADIEHHQHPHSAELMAAINHLIVSLDFARQITGAPDPAGAVKALASESRACTVVTAGGQGCWYAIGQGQVIHQPAFQVEVRDTTGCGDVFHGAYAAALIHGLEQPEVIKFASAAAALKAARPGGRAGIPSREAVEAFLSEWGGTLLSRASG